MPLSAAGALLNFLEVTSGGLEPSSPSMHTTYAAKSVILIDLRCRWHKVIWISWKARSCTPKIAPHTLPLGPSVKRKFRLLKWEENVIKRSTKICSLVVGVSYDSRLFRSNNLYSIQAIIYIKMIMHFIS